MQSDHIVIPAASAPPVGRLAGTPPLAKVPSFPVIVFLGT